MADPPRADDAPNAPAVRIGLGFDVHPREAGRELWLGGLKFEGEEGLRGHSDGDAVCHAIADALFGAAALGDVGEHFPESDPAIAGIAGSELLRRAAAVLAGAGLRPASCDVTVVCELPPIAPRRAEMLARLADVLGLPADRVSVKATRPEGLGLSGDGVGCLAIAVVT
jgi:2-C-methyl-D-erythritol 2,4-cyclodiphosphate synthase